MLGIRVPAKTTTKGECLGTLKAVFREQAVGPQGPPPAYHVGVGLDAATEIQGPMRGCLGSQPFQASQSTAIILNGRGVGEGE